MEEEKKIKYICMYIRYKEKITVWKRGSGGGRDNLRQYYSIN